MAGHAIMPTSGGDLFTAEQTLDEGEGLGQPLDPDASRVEGQPRLFIFGLHCMCPAPKPSWSRPSVSRSTVAASRAISTGRRNSLLRTLVPDRRLCPVCVLGDRIATRKNVSIAAISAKKISPVAPEPSSSGRTFRCTSRFMQYTSSLRPVRVSRRQNLPRRSAVLRRLRWPYCSTVIMRGSQRGTC